MISAQIARAETLASDEMKTLEDLILRLDYNDTFTVEVVLDGTIVSVTRHNLGEVSRSETSVSLTIDRSGGVSIDVPTLSPISGNEIRPDRGWTTVGCVDLLSGPIHLSCRGFQQSP